MSYRELVDELTAKTYKFDDKLYVTAPDYAKACSIALELRRKNAKLEKELEEARGKSKNDL